MKYRARNPERDARPLTPEEARFAEEHIAIVWWYLHRRGLDSDEWFDVVVIRYLQAVKLWNSEPELQRYSFTTIARNAMRSAISNELAKESRRPRTVSLYEPIPGTDNLTPECILAAPA